MTVDFDALRNRLAVHGSVTFEGRTAHSEQELAFIIEAAARTENRPEPQMPQALPALPVQIDTAAVKESVVEALRELLEPIRRDLASIKKTLGKMPDEMDQIEQRLGQVETGLSDLEALITEPAPKEGEPEQTAKPEQSAPTETKGS